MDEVEEPAGADDAAVDRNVLPPGARLEEFEIEKCLGSGGFGITYLAKDHHLQRRVAIKEYFPFDVAYRESDSCVSPRTQTATDLEEYQWGLKSIVEEARTLARFEHPNIVRVIRYIEANGTAYIVMEYVPGRELSDIIRERDVLDIDTVVSLLLPIMDGLEAVHRTGMLHRDIKPGNIIVRDDGHPVLIDFGAARQAIGSRSRSLSAIVTHGYAPIEQYSTKGEQGPWTDIYALAAVGYSCLKGEPPEDATERVLEDSTEPLKTMGSHPALTALDWGLRVKKDDRPQTVEAWSEAFGDGAVRSAMSGATTRLAETKTQRVAETPRRAASPKAPAGLARWVAAGVGALGIVGALTVAIVANRTDPGSSVVVNPDRSQGASLAEAPPSSGDAAPADRTQADDPPPQRTPPDETPPARDAVDAVAAADLAVAQKIATREAYIVFLKLHPTGEHSDRARELLRNTRFDSSDLQ